MHLSKEIFNTPYWVQNCDRLKYCADLLITDLLKIKGLHNRKFNPIRYNQNLRGLLETNLMLLGYAIENCLKGLLMAKFLIENNIPENADLKFLKRNVWLNCDGHNLPSLAKNANLTLSPEEFDFLSKLKKYIVWKGRYHIPTSHEEIQSNLNPGEGDKHTSQDQIIAEIIINRIKLEIQKNSS